MKIRAMRNSGVTWLTTDGDESNSSARPRLVCVSEFQSGAARRWPEDLQVPAARQRS